MSLGRSVSAIKIQKISRIFQNILDRLDQMNQDSMTPDSHYTLVDFHEVGKQLQNVYTQMLDLGKIRTANEIFALAREFHAKLNATYTQYLQKFETGITGESLYDCYLTHYFIKIWSSDFVSDQYNAKQYDEHHQHCKDYFFKAYEALHSVQNDVQLNEIKLSYEIEKNFLTGFKNKFHIVLLLNSVAMTLIKPPSDENDIHDAKQKMAHDISLARFLSKHNNDKNSEIRCAALEEKLKKFPVSIEQKEEAQLTSTASTTNQLGAHSGLYDAFTKYCSNEIFKALFNTESALLYTVSNLSQITHYIGFDFDCTLISENREDLYDDQGILIFEPHYIELLRNLPPTCLVEVITARQPVPENIQKIKETLKAIEDLVGRGPIFSGIHFTPACGKEFILEHKRDLDLPHLPRNRICLPDDQPRFVAGCRQAGFTAIQVPDYRDANADVRGYFNQFYQFLGMAVPAPAPVEVTPARHKRKAEAPTSSTSAIEPKEFKETKENKKKEIKPQSNKYQFKYNTRSAEQESKQNSPQRPSRNSH